MEKRFSSKRAQSKSIECANYDLFFCGEFDSLVPILCNSGVFLAKCLLHFWSKYTFLDFTNKEETYIRVFNWKKTGFKVLLSVTALVPNISKEILCRPTWVIQIPLFKLIFPFLLGCYMAICHTFLTIALACFEGIWFTCFGYILHIFGSLSTMFWVLNISFDMTFPFVTQAISLLGCESLVFIPLYSFFQNCVWN